MNLCYWHEIDHGCTAGSHITNTHEDYAYR